MKEYRVIGPPGTGKTWYVAEQAERAAAKFGPGSVMVCSFTKAAAAEAAGRCAGISKEMIGTVHAACYRGLGRPKVVSAKEIVAWNAEHLDLLISADSFGGSSVDDRSGEASGKQSGDILLSKLDLFRATKTPLEMDSQLAGFADKWSSWKRSNHVVDFTDLIELATENLAFAPGQPRVIFFDEQQDSSRLETDLVRKWTRLAEQVVMIGDPDQTLYSWRGADPSLLSDDSVPEQNIFVRSRSYRVPRAVHARAMRIVQSIPGRRQVEYLPRDEEGELIHIKATYRDVNEISALVERVTSHGETVMVIGACEYMIQPLVAALRERGVPYHNPYNGKWSPIRLRTAESTPTWERLVAFMTPFGQESTDFVPAWTPAQVRSWAAMLRVDGVVKRGLKKSVETVADSTAPEELSKIILNSFTPEALDALLTGDAKWIVDNSTVKFQKSAELPLKVIGRLGVERFLNEIKSPPRKRPWVTVGTIHSVKGGEADNVVIFPDLSPSFYNLSTVAGWTGVDSLKRMYYVALTRAKKRAIIASPAGSLYYKI